MFFPLLTLIIFLGGLFYNYKINKMKYAKLMQNDYQEYDIKFSDTTESIVGFEMYEIERTMSAPIYLNGDLFNIPVTSSKPEERMHFVTALFQVNSESNNFVTNKLKPHLIGASNIINVNPKNYNKTIEDIVNSITNESARTALIDRIDNTRRDVVLYKYTTHDNYLVSDSKIGFFGKNKSNIVWKYVKHNSNDVFIMCMTSVVAFAVALFGMKM